MSYYPTGMELVTFAIGIFVVAYAMHRAGYIDKLIDQQREYHRRREQNRWPE